MPSDRSLFANLCRSPDSISRALPGSRLVPLVLPRGGVPDELEGEVEVVLLGQRLDEGSCHPLDHVLDVLSSHLEQLPVSEGGGLDVLLHLPSKVRVGLDAVVRTCRWVDAEEPPHRLDRVAANLQVPWLTDPERRADLGLGEPDHVDDLGGILPAWLHGVLRDVP